MANWQQYEGQAIDFDGYYGAQCFDLVNRFSVDNGYRAFTGLYASDIFGQQSGNYTWAKNSPTGIPPANSVVVWNRNYGSGYGHTAIATGEGNTNYFVSLDQNWSGPKATRIRHNYDGVIGWGIPKNNSIINEGAKNMTPDEEKLAYNIVLGRQPEPEAKLGNRTAWAFIRESENELSAIRAGNAKAISEARAEIGKLNEKQIAMQKEINDLKTQVKSNVVDNFSLGQLAGAFFRRLINIK